MANLSVWNFISPTVCSFCQFALSFTFPHFTKNYPFVLILSTISSNHSKESGAKFKTTFLGSEFFPCSLLRIICLYLAYFSLVNLFKFLLSLLNCCYVNWVFPVNPSQINSIKYFKKVLIFDDRWFCFVVDQLFLAD